MKRYHLIILLPSLLLPLAACEERSAKAAGPVISDSAGIPIVENTAPTWEQEEKWKVAEQPTVDIGALDGDPNYQLYRASSVTRLSDGRIVVANSGTHELRIYSSEGRYLQTIGREGEGPGEFEGSLWVDRIPGDTLVVWDQGSERISVFSPDGEFVRSSDVDVGNLFPSVHDAFSDGSLLVDEGFDPSIAAGGDGPRQDTTTFFRIARDGAWLDTLGSFPSEKKYVLTGSRGFSSFSIPFSSTTFVAASGDRFYVGTSSRYEITVYDGKGNVGRLIRGPERMLELNSGDIERYKEERLGRIENEDFRADVERMLAEVSFPEALPAFMDLVVDKESNLWVERSRLPGDEQPRWDVFDPGGQWLGTVETPPDFRIAEIGADYVLGIFQDEFDVEHVRMYRLIKP